MGKGQGWPEGSADWLGDAEVCTEKLAGSCVRPETAVRKLLEEVLVLLEEVLDSAYDRLGLQRLKRMLEGDKKGKGKMY